VPPSPTQERFGGRGAIKAAKNVADLLAPALKGLDPIQQKQCDEAIMGADGTHGKKHVGTNASTACSMALACAGAEQSKCELFEHLYRTFVSSPEDSLAGPADGFRMPLPVVTVIVGNHTLPFSSISLVPAPYYDVSDALNVVYKVARRLEEILAKEGADPELQASGQEPFLGTWCNWSPIIQPGAELDVLEWVDAAIKVCIPCPTPLCIPCLTPLCIPCLTDYV
jgi:enolase